MNSHPHISVMAQEVFDDMALDTPCRIIDATLGFGGHAEFLLKHTDIPMTYLGIDQDRKTLNYAKQRLEGLASKHTLMFEHANFEAISDLCKTRNFNTVDRILADLWVSSAQLDEKDRWFSYHHDGPLDMRMNPEQGIPLSEWLLTQSIPELSLILSRYGDEPFAKKIARAIFDRTQIQPLKTTQELCDLIEQTVPKFSRGYHPARRTFQALRIALNREMDVLESFLNKSWDLLSPNGRLTIITFHSLEDRIVTSFYKSKKGKQWFDPYGQATTESLPPVTLLKKHVPSAAELEHNPRSRSAIVRTIIKGTS